MIGVYNIPPTWQNSSLTAAVLNLNVLGSQIQGWALGGSVPSPTIRVRKGSLFSMQLYNQLAAETNLHWHGLSVPANMDGHPKDIAEANGGSIAYNFPILNNNGTYWYHPHSHMNTAKQTYMGMAGMFIIEDPDLDTSLGLPTGDFDVPLILQDKRFQQYKNLTYAPSVMDYMTGYLGDTMFVNGVPVPYYDIENGVYRFRILNGATARILKLGFDNAMPFYVIGSDGGLLESSSRITTVLLAPGERVEILVDFSKLVIGDSVLLKSLEFTLPVASSNVGSTMGNMDGMMSSGYRQGVEMPIIRFVVKRPTTRRSILPTSLSAVSRLNSADASKTRTFALQMEMMSGANSTGSRNTMSGAQMMVHTINGKVFEMSRVDETIPLGSTEIWEFQNQSAEPHPMHVHGTQFQILSRSSGDVSPLEKGWKDTVLVNSGETVRIILRFDKYRGTYLLHCHNLEHEDSGMMINFQVT